MPKNRLNWESPEVKAHLRANLAWRLKIGEGEPRGAVSMRHWTYAKNAEGAVKIFRLRKIQGVAESSVVRYPRKDRI